MIIPESLIPKNCRVLKVGLVLGSDLEALHFEPVLASLIESSFIEIGDVYQLKRSISYGFGRESFAALEAALKGKKRSGSESLNSHIEEMKKRSPDCRVTSVHDVSQTNFSDQHDLILNLSFSAVSTEQLESPVWSVWYEFEEGLVNHPVSLTRMLVEAPALGVHLFVEGASTGERQQVASSAARKSSFLSLRSYLRAEGQCVAEMISWQLLRMSLWGADAHPQQHRVDMGSCAGFKKPSRAALKPLLLLIRRVFASLNKPKRAERTWQAGLRKRSQNAIWQDSNVASFQMIDAPDEHYFADPFVYEHDGKTWLFVEDYVNEESKGRLVCAQVSESGEIGEWTSILDLPFHLSFPMIIEDQGELFLLPECQQSGQVTLYRATQFPFAWVEETVLLDLPGLDTVPFKTDAGDWFAYTSVQTQNLPPHLLLFTARELKGPWTLHPASPLSSDARYSRNGGQLIAQDDATRTRFRVSQDGTGKYGSKLDFHEIKHIDHQSYSETRVGSVTPIGRYYGLHQYDRSEHWECIDMAPIKD